ncbi:MAG: iron-containing alcohol dehydrogenase [Francisellaceae bacterium]|jgi:alcohol dehydrogenase class IV|nr:iron-containing alcohol dehydrogenase [Francisellaceae bacterium]
MTVFRFPTKIMLSSGAVSQLSSSLKELNINKPIIVTDANLVAMDFFSKILDSLIKQDIIAKIFSGCFGNPTEEQVKLGVEVFREHKSDGIIAIGGGCPLDVAKAINLLSSHDGRICDYEDGVSTALPIRDKLAPIIAIPTTAGTGSEVGGSFVVSEKGSGKKIIVWSPYLLPKLVIADPELTVDLPPHITAATGIDALCHNVEAFLVNAFHPMCDGIALEGVRLINENILKVYNNPLDISARKAMLMAAMMGAVAFQKGLGVTHSCSHALSSCFDAHHGHANAIMFVPCMKFNFSGQENKFLQLAKIISPSTCPKAQDFIVWLEKLLQDLNLYGPLSNLDAHVSDDLIEKANLDPCHKNNPKPVSKADFLEIFSMAESIK